jgi:hypothetical protein
MLNQLSLFKRTTIAALCAVSLQNLAAPTQSHAIIGAVTGGSTVAIGGALLGLGVVTGTTSALFVAVCSVPYNGCDGNVLLTAIGLSAAAILGGIILLDEGTAHVEFRALSPQEALRFKLTEAERHAFNSEIEEINLVGQSASADLAARMAPASVAERYEAALSPLTVSAVRKVLGELR